MFLNQIQTKQVIEVEKQYSLIQSLKKSPVIESGVVAINETESHN